MFWILETPTLFIGLIFSFLGSIFLLIGIGLLMHGWSSHQVKTNLRNNGEALISTIKWVENSGTTVNGTRYLNIYVDVQGQDSMVRNVHPRDVIDNLTGSHGDEVYGYPSPGDKLAINLVSGTAQVEGRVRTVFQPSNN